MADKASNYITYKEMNRDKLRDCAKYVKITSKDKNGKKIKPVIEIDREKLNENLKAEGGQRDESIDFTDDGEGKSDLWVLNPPQINGCHWTEEEVNLQPP